MSKVIWNALKLSPAVLAASLLVANSTIAAEAPAAQIVPAQTEAAATDQTIGSQATINDPTQQSEQPEVTQPSVAAIASATETQVRQASENVTASSAPAIETQTQQALKSVSVSPAPIEANIAPATVLVGQVPEGVNSSPAPITQTPGYYSPVVQPTSNGQEQINPYSNVDGNIDPSVGQVTNVSQFRDVRPGDWAYEALRELVERYGCIAGYPDSTYRGNRALTRYEFAAGLRACLNQVEKLIAASTADFATKTDLETLRRLTQEFQAELATLGTRVDKLEGRVGFLETRQFSTTTKLNAEVIGAVIGFGGSRTAVGSGAPRSTENLNDNVIFTDRVRLNFDTSFTGRDRLRTRLEANNTPNINTEGTQRITGSAMSRVGFDNNLGNDIVLGRLEYRFPLTPATTVFITATGGEFNDQVNTNNPLVESSALGAISRFGRYNPIYRLSNTGSAGNTGGGITVVQKFSDQLSISGGYLARTPQDPGVGRGLFNGSYAALGQVNFQATRAFGLGLTYIHAYQRGDEVAASGSTGSGYANNPFGSSATFNVPTSVNAYGVQASFRLSQFVTISGWGGLNYSTAERSRSLVANGPRVVRKGDNATSYNVGVTLAFPDLGKRGNLGALIFGIPPKLTRNDSEIDVNNTQAGIQRRRDRNTSYHLEGLYRYQVTNNISITPGVLVILNPEHNTRNATEYVGVVRTTFTF